MDAKTVIITIGLIYSLICTTNCMNCDRTPDDVVKPKNINDINTYLISIQGNPKTYTPSQRYNVSLKVNPYSLRQKAFRRFILTSEPLLEKSLTPAGQFDIEYGAEVLTTFSDNCPNTVIENSALPKYEIQVYWIAPPENSGCIAIRATVVETRENWFSEDGQLTKILCEETAEDENVQPDRLPRCCACAEAKYEVAFEGRWTRNTHPRNYPQDVWSTRFSNIIGASHKRGGSFWQEGDFASDGLKELARSGSTKSLESELKEASENIRTIIQARGLQHPHITESTYAVFRVDNKNHRVSLVSKIVPSPDWIVGVSEFELCKSDCTWLDSYTYNLYPMDVGIDDGIGYTSSQPLFNRPKPIVPITQNNPNDPQSPFYSEEGEKMNPIAKLHFTRQRLYEKPCSDIYMSSEDSCATTDWTPWLPCSSKCGRGKTVRVRQYEDPANNETCNEVLFQEMTCWGESQDCDASREQPGREYVPEIEMTEEPTATIASEDARCAAGPWSRWSSCSVSCGKGTRTRERRILNQDYEDVCRGAELQQNEECFGTEKDCDEMPEESNCQNTNWGQWSWCNATRCGEVGTKMRLRLPDNNESYEKGSNAEEEGEPACSNQEVVECYGICEEETDKIGESQIVEQAPDGRVVNCKVSQWSIWSECNVNGAKCGRGVRTRVRQILRHPENGGRSCPRKLMKKQRCTKPCPKSTEETQHQEINNDNSDSIQQFPIEIRERIRQRPYECIMSKWSDLSPCNINCGPTAKRQRTRFIIYQPPGVVCPPRLEEKSCNLPLACTNKGTPIFL